MIESEGMVQTPLKVAIFAAEPIAIPVVSMLIQQGRLAGVILPEQHDAFSQQLQGWLLQQQIPCARYSSAKAKLTAELIGRWEAELTFYFGCHITLPAVVADKPVYGSYYFHTVSPGECQGSSPLYWLLRSQATSTQLTLQKAIADEQNIADTFDMPIHPLDTMTCLQNNIAQQAAVMVNGLIEKIFNSKEPHLSVGNKGKPQQTSRPREEDLYVNWATMESDEIAAMARAGNSDFAGCVVVLRQTPLSLLQATVVKHPTYGVPPGTICHIAEPEGVIVATRDGAIRLDILSNADGVFSAMNFAERFQINAGVMFEASSVDKH